jgi:hypothetical protein
MLKRFGAMSRKTLLMLSAAALCALGIGTAVAIAGANDTDDTLNVASGTTITATVNGGGARFQGKAGGTVITCLKSSSGYTTTEAKEKLPNEVTLNNPALSFTECNNFATVTVNGSTQIKLDSADVNPETTGEDPQPEDKDTGTMIVPAGSSIVIEVPGCTVTISGRQEFEGIVGEHPATLTFANVNVKYTAEGFLCEGLGIKVPEGVGLFNATYNVTPEGLDDNS